MSFDYFPHYCTKLIVPCMQKCFPKMGHEMDLIIPYFSSLSVSLRKHVSCLKIKIKNSNGKLECREQNARNSIWQKCCCKKCQQNIVALKKSCCRVTKIEIQKTRAAKNDKEIFDDSLLYKSEQSCFGLFVASWLALYSEWDGATRRGLYCGY